MSEIEDVPLSVIQQYLDQVQGDDDYGRSGSGNQILWQGKVSGIDAATGKLTVMIGGANVPNLRCLQSPPPRVGDVIWGVQEGRTKIALGRLYDNARTNPELLAIGIVSSATGGACKGTYAGGANFGNTLTVGTSASNTNLQTSAIPIRPNRFLRVKFHFWAAGPPNSSNEWYFEIMVSWNGGGYTQYEQCRYAPAGGNAGAPEGEAIIITPADATSITVAINVRVLSGTASLYQYNGSAPACKSHITVEDIGSAKYYNEQL